MASHAAWVVGGREVAGGIGRHEQRVTHAAVYEVEFHLTVAHAGACGFASDGDVFVGREHILIHHSRSREAGHEGDGGVSRCIVQIDEFLHLLFLVYHGLQQVLASHVWTTHELCDALALAWGDVVLCIEGGEVGGTDVEFYGSRGGQRLVANVVDGYGYVSLLAGTHFCRTQHDGIHGGVRQALVGDECPAGALCEAVAADGEDNGAFIVSYRVLLGIDTHGRGLLSVRNGDGMIIFQVVLTVACDGHSGGAILARVAAHSQGRGFLLAFEERRGRRGDAERWTVVVENGESHGGSTNLTACCRAVA